MTIDDEDSAVTDNEALDDGVLTKMVVKDLRAGFGSAFRLTEETAFYTPFTDREAGPPLEVLAPDRSGGAVVWAFDAIHVGPFEGVAATGRKIHVQGTTVVQVVNGEQVALRHFDRAAVVAQMGARLYTRIDADPDPNG